MHGFINLNKPAGLTSFGCVAKIRKLLSTKKVGHAGTLDPDARGVLPIAVGKATRLLEYVTSITKEYHACMTFGIQTATQDASGEIIREIDSSHLTKNHVLDILPQFIGEIEQIPPMYSAVKINGQRLYELARKNIEVDRKPRKVIIEDITLKSFTEGKYPSAVIDVVCSKGTYIRTLIEDIGTALGTTAHMTSLTRTRVGVFSIENAVTLEELTQKEGAAAEYILPMNYPLQQLGAIEVTDRAAARILHGNAVSLREAEIITYNPENIYCLYNNKSFLAIAGICDDVIKIIKVLRTEGEK